MWPGNIKIYYLNWVSFTEDALPSNILVRLMIRIEKRFKASNLRFQILSL